MITRIGFIGLGIMGKPMAINLLDGGFQLVVHDVNREAVQELVVKGAEEAFSPKEVSGSTDAIISILPDDHVVEQVATGKDGVIEGMSEGSVFVDMSTISPITARKI